MSVDFLVRWFPRPLITKSVDSLLFEGCCLRCEARQILHIYFILLVSFLFQIFYVAFLWIYSSYKLCRILTLQHEGSQMKNWSHSRSSEREKNNSFQMSWKIIKLIRKIFKTRRNVINKKVLKLNIFKEFKVLIIKNSPN